MATTHGFFYLKYRAAIPGTMVTLQENGNSSKKN